MAADPLHRLSAASAQTQPWLGLNLLESSPVPSASRPSKPISFAQALAPPAEPLEEESGVVWPPQTSSFLGRHFTPASGEWTTTMRLMTEAHSGVNELRRSVPDPATLQFTAGALGLGPAWDQPPPASPGLPLGNDAPNADYWWPYAP
jgi:hypothetical protein